MIHEAPPERAGTGLAVHVDALDANRGFALSVLCIQLPLIAALQTLPLSVVSDGMIRHLNHSAWHGCTFFDLGFPAYIMYLAMSMTFSYRNRRARGQTTGELLRHVAIRSLLLFALGLFVHGGFSVPLSEFRFTRVLQRLAIAIFLSGLIECALDWRGQIVLLVAVLGGYAVLMAEVAAPGYSAGDYSPEGNLNQYVDKVLLGAQTYFVLSTLGVVGTCLLGLLGGHLLQINRSVKEKAMYIGLAGIGLLNIGVVWDLVCPINKHLWTPSFVFFSAGWICFIFLAFYLPMELLGWKKWAFPFVVLGKSPLMTYLFVQLLPLGRFAELVAGKGLIPVFGCLQPFLHAVTQLCILCIIVYWIQGRSAERRGSIGRA